MTRLLSFLALSVFAAQGSVIRSDGTLIRIARSSPPNFHTQQISGILRSADGSQQGVFSGAAASAQDDTHAGAYSVASASSSADQPIVYPGLTSSDASSQPVKLETNQTKAGSQANASENTQGSGLESRFGGYEDRNPFAYGSQGNGANNFGPNCDYGYQSSAGAQASAQSAGNGYPYGNQGYGGNYAPVPQQSGYGSQSNYVGQPGSYGSQTYNAGPGGYPGQPIPVSQPGGYGSQSGGYDSGYGGHQSSQSALQDALGLASQGLQSQQGPGCTTCGKSTYAYSNAKATNGNAIALSVG